MGKNDKQIVKALQKINLINTLIELFEKCNELEDYNNMKSYIVTLNHSDKIDYTKFSIKLKKVKSEKKDTIFEMSFSLNDKQKGLELFQKLREKFVERDNIQYTGFYIDNISLTKHFIKKNNNVELKTTIHDENELKNLENYNKKIGESNVFGYKGFNTNNKTKDQLQLIKAQAKANIVCSIINTLSQLNNLEEDYNDMKSYKLDISYSINDDKYDEKYYKYNINLIKHGVEKDKKLLHINFSLKNHNTGLKIIEKIIKNFSENTDILLTSFDNEENSVILNKSKVEIITNLKTNDEKQMFISLHNEIKDNKSINSKVKKIEKK